MKLEFCNPDLIPRQELQYIACELRNLRCHIDELVNIDTGLKGSLELYEIMRSLVVAEKSCYAMRCHASDCTCQALADNWHADRPIKI